MAFNVQKIMTFLNLQSLVQDEGFGQKQSIPSTKQAVRVDEVGDYIVIDESGTIGGYANNRLVRRGIIVDGSNGFESIMRTAYGSNTGSCSTVTVGIKHDGSNVLPIEGDKIYTTDEVLENGNSLYASVSRYPGYDDNKIIQVNSSGVVTYREWCTDKSIAPSSLAGSTNCSTGITLTWGTNSRYETPSFRVFRYGVNIGGLLVGGTTQYIDSTAQSGQTYEYYVRAYETSDGTGSYKQSSTITKTMPACLTSFSMGYIPQSTSSAACGSGASGTYYHDGTGTYPVNSDIIYTDSGGTTKFNGGGSYFKIVGNNRWMTIDSVGVVTSNGSC